MLTPFKKMVEVEIVIESFRRVIIWRRRRLITRIFSAVVFAEIVSLSNG